MELRGSAHRAADCHSIPSTSYARPPRVTSTPARWPCSTCSRGARQVARAMQLEDDEEELIIPPEFAVIDSFFRNAGPRASQNYAAFYSSILGGIVTDPALMVINMDDRMVHRGTGVFDTAILVEGHLYQLDQHLDRFARSAEMARIPLPVSLPQLRRIILETAAASLKQNGFVRYWLSSGRGDMGLDPLGCDRPTFYVLVYTHRSTLPVLKGWRVKTCPIAPKTAYFSTMKSVEYMTNTLAIVDAQDDGFDQGIFVGPDGNVTEGPNMNIGFLSQDDELVIAPFDHALAGLTMQRLMEIMPPYLERGDLPAKSIVQRPFTVEEAKTAKEVFVTGSSLPLMPVVAWDDAVFDDGTAGVVALGMRDALLEDQETIQLGTQHTPVPYGYLTGML